MMPSNYCYDTFNDFSDQSEDTAAETSANFRLDTSTSISRTVQQPSSRHRYEPNVAVEDSTTEFLSPHLTKATTSPAIRRQRSLHQTSSKLDRFEQKQKNRIDNTKLAAENNKDDTRTKAFLNDDNVTKPQRQHNLLLVPDLREDGIEKARLQQDEKTQQHSVQDVIETESGRERMRRISFVTDPSYSGESLSVHPDRSRSKRRAASQKQRILQACDETLESMSWNDDTSSLHRHKHDRPLTTMSQSETSETIFTRALPSLGLGVERQEVLVLDGATTSHSKSSASSVTWNSSIIEHETSPRQNSKTSPNFIKHKEHRHRQDQRRRRRTSIYVPSPHKALFSNNIQTNRGDGHHRQQDDADDDLISSSTKQNFVISPPPNQRRPQVRRRGSGSGTRRRASIYVANTSSSSPRRHSSTGSYSHRANSTTKARRLECNTNRHFPLTRRPSCSRLPNTATRRRSSLSSSMHLRDTNKNEEEETNEICHLSTGGLNDQMSFNTSISSLSVDRFLANTSKEEAAISTKEELSATSTTNVSRHGSKTSSSERGGDTLPRIPSRTSSSKDSSLPNKPKKGGSLWTVSTASISTSAKSEFQGSAEPWSNNENKHWNSKDEVRSMSSCPYDLVPIDYMKSSSSGGRARSLLAVKKKIQRSLSDPSGSFARQPYCGGEDVAFLKTTAMEVTTNPLLKNQQPPRKRFKKKKNRTW